MTFFDVFIKVRQTAIMSGLETCVKIILCSHYTSCSSFVVHSTGGEVFPQGNAENTNRPIYLVTNTSSIEWKFVLVYKHQGRVLKCKTYRTLTVH